MNEHAGPACALSGLIVGFFAVLLHDHMPVATLSRTPGREKVAVGAFELSPITSPVPPPLPPASAPRESARILPSITPVTLDWASTPDPSPFVSSPLKKTKLGSVGRVSDLKRPTSPRSAFAMVAEGESLPEVAERVYGSRLASEALWKANRDQVERVDSPLAIGTLLRTP